MKNRWLVLTAYSYSGLHILSWWAVVSSNGNDWLATLAGVTGVVVLPLHMVSLGVCGLAWGSTNVFQARVVLGLVADVAVVSLLTVSGALLGITSWRKRAIA